MTRPPAPPPGDSPFAPWSLSAALLRFSVTLGALALLGAALLGSLERLDAGQVKALLAQTSRVAQPLGGAGVLDVTVSSALGRTLNLAASDAPTFTAQLSASASRVSDLALDRAWQGDTLKLRLSRNWRGLPLAVALDSAGGSPAALSIQVPTRTPLRLALTRVAENSRLDLRRAALERLDYVGGNGNLNVTLPASGQPRLSLSSSGGLMTLTLPPGSARITLEARSVGGDVSLNAPASARVTLNLRLGKSRPTFSDLPKSFQFVAAGSGRSTRRYVQRGVPGGPQLTADLDLDGGSLVVNGGSP